jgi:hypothetical protein
MWRMAGLPGRRLMAYGAANIARRKKNRACGEKDYFTISQNPVAVCKPFFYIARYDINLK